MKKNLFNVLIFLLFSSSIFAVGKNLSLMIGSGVAIFYPANFKAKANLPSFALLKEPKTIGKIPDSWKIFPHFYSKDGKSIATFSIQKGTSLYGTGEIKGPLLRNGEKITLWNTDNWKYLIDNGKRLYQSHPWILGVNADGSSFGIIADNTWKQQMEMTDSIRFISYGPAFRLIVIQRNSPQEVVEELGKLVGTMKMPPLWALGFQQSRYSYVPDKRVESVADTFRLKKLPCDVLWMDIDYMDNYKIFTFDSLKIPHPQAVNNYLHAAGFHSVWMIDPGVKIENNYFVYEEGSKGNHWVEKYDRSTFIGKVWPGNCVFPDFTRPATRHWWSGLYIKFMATGIDGVWNDMNEPSVFDGPNGTMPEDNWHRGGGGLPADIHRRYHNVYGMLMVKASREGILKANPDKRPFILSRSGYLGSARYAATWTGDNNGNEDNMKVSIPMTLNIGLSGQPFSGPDLGGFALNTTADLFGQWISMGVFFPFCRAHASKETNNKEPWAFGSKIENVSRTALNRRYQLLPYYYTLFHEAAQNGMPIMRPIFFADPKDTALRAEDQAFLIGNDIMIIPRWAIKPKLPMGIWRNLSFESDPANDDGYQATVKIKGGSIIPMIKTIQNTNDYSLDSLRLVVSLDKLGKAVGSLYEDAGDGFGYQKGEYKIYTFRAEQEGSTVNIEILPESGKLKFKRRLYLVKLITDSGRVTTGWTNKNRISIKL